MPDQHLDDDALLLEFVLPKRPRAGDEKQNALLRRMLVLYAYVHEHDGNNPLWCWRAYLTARALGDPIPEWVLTYFDRAGHALWKIADDGYVGEKADDVGAALGVKRKGRGTVLTDGSDPRWLYHGFYVARRLRNGDKEGIAIEEVAKKGHVSPATVRRHWARYKTVFPSDA